MLVLRMEDVQEERWPGPLQSRQKPKITCTQGRTDKTVQSDLLLGFRLVVLEFWRSPESKEHLLKLSRLLIYFILGLPVASVCAAQSFIFVSPNTREHLSDQDAIASLDSFEENNFLAVADYLSGRVCAHPKA